MLAFGIEALPKKPFGIASFRPMPYSSRVRAKLRAHSRADIGHQNREIQQLKQKHSTGLSRHQRKRGFHLIRRKRFEPHTSCAA